MNALVAGDLMMARIKELEKELAALKASLPQIKHNAIIEARDATREDGFFDEGELCSVLDLTQYANDLKGYYYVSSN
tara:strand:+ start:314 stop:544 length:231 start_codon:yes stop_codon:yes gene_type:complete